MLYLVKYNCDPAFPTMLRIEYRQYGTLPWRDISQSLWCFAEQIWGNEYHYEKTGIHGRLVFMQTVLNERYDGDLEKYVADIVRYDVLERRAEMEERREIDMIMSQFDTHGWRQHTVEIEDNA